MGINVNVATGVCWIGQQEYSAIGFGTAHWKRAPNLCLESVRKAAEVGYRIIDTATRYQNFGPIKEALEWHDRSKFYIISKAWHDKQTPEKLRKDLNNALKELGTSYIDAYFLHWPNSQVSIEETLHTMEELRRSHLIHHIGLSNVTVHHLKRALQVDVPIDWVQVEMSPYFCDLSLLAFCKEHSIAVQASAPLHEGGIDQDPYLSELGEKYGKTAAQISLRWILQHGCVPLPRSSNPKRIEENKDILDFSLSKKEMEKIDENAKRGTRTVRVVGEAVKKEGFEDEFDLPYEQCWPLK